MSERRVGVTCMIAFFDATGAREARFGEEVFDIHVISNVLHMAAVAGHEDHMVRPHVLLAKVRGEDLAALQPTGNNVPSGSLRVGGEVLLDAAAAGALSARDDVEPYVIREHRTKSVPIPSVEQRRVARDGE